MYDAIDEGDMKLLGKMRVPKTLCLKKNCSVMLVKNLGKSLVIGMQVTVLELKENAVTVKFENIVTDVKTYVFSVYNSVNDRVKAS